MLTYKGGHKVGKGTYWDFTRGRRIDVTGEAVLAGPGTATYVRMAPGIMLLTGPAIGLLYALAVPVLGIFTVTILAARRVLEGMYYLAVKSVTFGWRPKNAYLSGKKKRS